jgi:hypothetical protein
MSVKRSRVREDSSESDAPDSSGNSNTNGEKSPSQNPERQDDEDDDESSPENEQAENLAVVPARRQDLSNDDVIRNDSMVPEMLEDLMQISGAEIARNASSRNSNSDGDEMSEAAGGDNLSVRSRSLNGYLSEITLNISHYTDEGFPLYFRREFENVSISLRNLGVIKFDIPRTTHKDRRGVLTVPPRHVKTLDGVGKCLQLIPPGGFSMYSQPSDGFPWVFVSK